MRRKTSTKKPASKPRHKKQVTQTLKYVPTSHNDRVISDLAEDLSYQFSEQQLAQFMWLVELLGNTKDDLNRWSLAQMVNTRAFQKSCAMSKSVDLFIRRASVEMAFETGESDD